MRDSQITQVVQVEVFKR